MTTWEVTLTDRSIRTVEIHTHMPEHRAEYLARTKVDHDLIGEASHLNAFAARPAGCIGMAYNLHFGAEKACPVHRSAPAAGFAAHENGTR